MKKKQKIDKNRRRKAIRIMYGIERMLNRMEKLYISTQGKIPTAFFAERDIAMTTIRFKLLPVIYPVQFKKLHSDKKTRSITK